MKTKKEIEKEIKALKKVRPNVVPYSMFGTDNLAQLDACVDVLENLLGDGEIFDKYDHSGIEEEILSAALDARQWLDDEHESESLAKDYPIRGE